MTGKKTQIFVKKVGLLFNGKKNIFNAFKNTAYCYWKCRCRGARASNSANNIRCTKKLTRGERIKLALNLSNNLFIILINRKFY